MPNVRRSCSLKVRHRIAHGSARICSVLQVATDGYGQMGVAPMWTKERIRMGGFAAAPSALRPVADRLLLVMTRCEDQQFQVTLRRSGGLPIVALLGPHEVIRPSQIHELRRTYEQQLQMLHALAVAGAPVPPPDERDVLDLGRRIAHLLPAVVREEIVAAVRRARMRKHTLRLVLEVAPDARALLSVPWEVMAFPLGWGTDEGAGAEGFLFLNADVSLIRQVQGVGVCTPVVLDRPLRFQAFAATPQDVLPIDLQAAQVALAQGQVFAPAQHWYHGYDTLGALQSRLGVIRSQIVHVLCHGAQRDCGRGVPQYELLFTHPAGYVQRVSATDLARVFTLAPDLQVVVLQACHAGTTAIQLSEEMTACCKVIESIALGLVRAGVPIVVAMQGEVSQQAAAAFVYACYGALERGEQVFEAVAAGRVAMRVAGGVVDWSLPVLYQGSQPSGDSWFVRLMNRFERLSLRFPVGMRSVGS